MDPLPLAGNLSLYALLRQAVPETVLGAFAATVVIGLFLWLVAIWLWFWRPDAYPASAMEKLRNTTDIKIAESNSALVDARVIETTSHPAGR
ncbi:hypothetical protein [Burkholderia sp. S171]|uniref:hypothetical protein n=1 Tax=Burkholderia sp. S171 TaxID=1641860 RepID=UPI00131CD23E|nr:hypothetical protein [Burkholderia sp. S171]